MVDPEGGRSEPTLLELRPAIGVGLWVDYRIQRYSQRSTAG
ncbi:hypothetical protein [Neorhodopirellula lusitana]